MIELGFMAVEVVTLKAAVFLDVMAFRLAYMYRR